MKKWLACAWTMAMSAAYSRAQTPPEKIPALLPPHPELHATFWELHGWQCVVGALVFVSFVAAVIVWVRRPRAVMIASPAMQARHALEKLRDQPEDGVLVMTVSRILKRYVLSVLKLPPEELTTAEFRHALQAQPQVQPELAAATGDFLRRCDEWKFAPEHPAEKLGAVENALELVEQLEASRPPVINPEVAA